MDGKWKNTLRMHKDVFSPNGVAPTLTANGGGNTEKKIITNELVVVGKLEGGKWDKIYQMSRNVYDPNGIAPTLIAGEGGNNEKKIIVDDLYASREPREYEETSPTLRADARPFKVVAFRGRNPENPSDRTTGIKLLQRLEKRKDDLTNTLTTVQKDNMILECESSLVKRNYDKFVEQNGYIPEMFNPYNCKEITNIAPTQTANCGATGTSAAVLKLYNCTIRKLTPTECWRLMGWKDEQIDKIKLAGISNAQMYKQAGNGIVVTVLEAIFRSLFLFDNK